MIALLLLFSCITKGNYELLQVQLDATRSALNARNASCYEGLQARDEELARRASDLARVEKSRDELFERNAALQEEVDASRERIATLSTATCLDPGIPLPPLVEAEVGRLQDALDVHARHQQEEARHREAHARVATAFATLQFEGRLEVVEVEGQTVVRIPTVQIFNEGRVSVSPRGEKLLASVGAAVAASGDQPIQVGAHTDDQPYHTAEYDSTWEMGFEQAMTVLRYLRDSGGPARLSAASFAGTRPIAPNDTPETRKLNWRIELVFQGE